MTHWTVRGNCFRTFIPTALIFAVALILSSCKKQEGGNSAPPPTQVATTGNMALVQVDKPDQFPLVVADPFEAAAKLDVTGTVFPDIAREVPVISLASGRVVDIKVRLGDDVKKGQLLLKIQSPDSTNAFDTYLKAVNDERMNNKAYVRAKVLYEHGAISLGTLEQAEDAETDSQADLKAAEEQIDTLGIDKNHPSPVVPVYSPISGVIIQQNVTQAAAAGVTFSGSATAFTVADLSVVWIVCDVYESDLSKISLGQAARITTNAYPDKVLTGRISDIEPILDPSLRTAKVRLELANPGFLKVGMFTTATFESKHKDHFALVPAPSVLHLHDREWVFVPAGESKFRRIEVKAGQMVGDKQVILSGIQSGQQVISNVLQLEATLEAQ
jgi:cobalt-zinc-cadmium efflux system membrane fusion protein